jgi:hypothetical protein
MEKIKSDEEAKKKHRKGFGEKALLCIRSNGGV